MLRRNFFEERASPGPGKSASVRIDRYPFIKIGFIHQNKAFPRIPARSSGVNCWYWGKSIAYLFWHSTTSTANSRKTRATRNGKLFLLMIGDRINSSTPCPRRQARMYSTNKVDGVADRRCSTKESMQNATAAMNETTFGSSFKSNMPENSRKTLMRSVNCNARKVSEVT